jgi:hypothetical protein
MLMRSLSLDGVIAWHLQLGFSVIVRDDDYKNIYGAGPHPKRPVKDTKYGVCFRACLAFVPSFIASELKLVGQGALAEPTRIDFALEGGHANVGDARRLFELYKKDALPEWQHLIGEFDTSTKESVGAQAADFMAYVMYRAELLEHGQAASDIETSSYVADTPMIANNYPRAACAAKRSNAVPHSHHATCCSRSRTICSPSRPSAECEPRLKRPSAPSSIEYVRRAHRSKAAVRGPTPVERDMGRRRREEACFVAVGCRHIPQGMSPHMGPGGSPFRDHGGTTPSAGMLRRAVAKIDDDGTLVLDFTQVAIGQQGLVWKTFTSGDFFSCRSFGNGLRFRRGSGSGLCANAHGAPFWMIDFERICLSHQVA